MFLCPSSINSSPATSERILYKNFVQVGQDVKAMIADISNKKNAKEECYTNMKVCILVHYTNKYQLIYS